MLLQPCPQVGCELGLAGKCCPGLSAGSCRSRAGGCTQHTWVSKTLGLCPVKGSPAWAAPSSVSPAKKPPCSFGAAARNGCCLLSLEDLLPWDAWVSWGAWCGCAVALNQQLDPAVTASNPHRSLAQAFYAFSSGSRGTWRQHAGEIRLTLASREGRGKGKHFPSQRNRGSPIL